MSPAAPPTAADLPDRDGVMAQAGAENFTVASVLVGHETQRHLRAIYGFARLVDDVGDEATGDRTALLGVVADELQRVYDGMPSHPLMVELQRTVRACGLPSGPFERLIEANRRRPGQDPLRDVRPAARLLPAVRRAGRRTGAARVRRRDPEPDRVV